MENDPKEHWKFKSEKYGILKYRGQKGISKSKTKTFV